MYKLKKAAFFVKVTNALNQSYKIVAPNIDLNNMLYDYNQEPIRLNGRVKFTLKKTLSL